MTATEPTISIELTERQQSVTIDALYDKSAETDRYLSSYRDTEKPGPLDSCCAAHLARFEERSAQRADLLERKQHVRSAIDIVDGAVPAVWDNAVPRALADALRDREDDESLRAAEWLAEHENDDELWSLIGGLLDRITEFADPEGGRHEHRCPAHPNGAHTCSVTPTDPSPVTTSSSPSPASTRATSPARPWRSAG
ncbi:hypothetical protein QBA78_36540 [Streptomyces scabiei]|uniref:hypothetical protein n=1 Tax=Streptomyces scabiei TaxID=1930 RepID=UPI002FF42CC3